MVMLAQVPVPEWVPSYHHQFNRYLEFDINASTVIAALYLGYYYLLEPLAAVSAICL